MFVSKGGEVEHRGAQAGVAGCRCRHNTSGLAACVVDAHRVILTGPSKGRAIILPNPAWLKPTAGGRGMFRVWAVVIAAVLLLLSVPLRAGETPVTILDGRWTYNAARSRALDPDLKITPTRPGLFMLRASEALPWSSAPRAARRGTPADRRTHSP
jgi:hypothetical protein